MLVTDRKDSVEDDFFSIFDYRYSVEKIPLYDSAEDEPSLKAPRTVDNINPGSDTNGKNEYSLTMDASVQSEHELDSTALVVQPLDSAPPVDGLLLYTVKTEATEEMKIYSQDAHQAFPQKNAMISRIRSNSACRNYHIGSGPIPKKRSKPFNRKSKNLVQKHVDAKYVAQLLACKEAEEEVSKNEVRVVSFQNSMIPGIHFLIGNERLLSLESSFLCTCKGRMMLQNICR